MKIYSRAPQLKVDKRAEATGATHEALDLYLLACVDYLAALTRSYNQEIYPFRKYDPEFLLPEIIARRQKLMEKPEYNVLMRHPESPKSAQAQLLLNSIGKEFPQETDVVLIRPDADEVLRRVKFRRQILVIAQAGAAKNDDSTRVAVKSVA